MEDNKKGIKIDAQGSLGLLALGDVGITEWKKALKKADKEIAKEEKSKKK